MPIITKSPSAAEILDSSNCAVPVFIVSLTAYDSSTTQSSNVEPAANVLLSIKQVTLVIAAVSSHRPTPSSTTSSSLPPRETTLLWVRVDNASGKRVSLIENVLLKSSIFPINDIEVWDVPAQAPVVVLYPYNT